MNNIIKIKAISQELKNKNKKEAEASSVFVTLL